MSISDKTRRALREVGLTEYELKAYLTLLEYGPLTATRISKDSGLPYSKIYEVLRNLEKKGWVEAESGRPNKYYPKAPAEAVEAVRLRTESMIRDFEDQVLEELQPIYEKRGIRERPDIWIVRGEFNIAAKIREVIGKTKSELMLAVPILPRALFKIVSPDLLHVKSAGVKLRLMTTKGVDEKMLREIGKLADTRVRDQMFGGGLISDNKEVILLLGESGEETLAIWSDHFGLAKLSAEYFEYLWKGAKPLS